MRWEQMHKEKLGIWVGNLAVAALLMLGVLLTSCRVAGEDGKLTAGSAAGSTPDTQATLGTNLAPSPAATRPAITGPVTFEVADAAYRDGRYGESADLFDAYVERKPENAWGHYMLGLARWKAGDGERAESAFVKAIEIDPTHVKSLINLSRVLLDRGRPEAALDHARRAQELDSTSADVYRVLGRAQSDLGDVESAVTSYRTAISLDEQDAWALNNLGVLLIQLSRPVEALGPLAHAVDVRPGVATFHNNLGMALELAGYFVEAADQYRLAVEDDPGYGKAAANLRRIEGREDKDGLPQLDLPGSAQQFLDTINPVPRDTTFGWAPVESS